MIDRSTAASPAHQPGANAGGNVTRTVYGLAEPLAEFADRPSETRISPGLIGGSFLAFLMTIFCQ
jgi:hypothetical protein